MVINVPEKYIYKDEAVSVLFPDFLLAVVSVDDWKLDLLQ
jgi:hypothetical protein